VRGRPCVCVSVWGPSEREKRWAELCAFSRGASHARCSSFITRSLSTAERERARTRTKLNSGCQLCAPAASSSSSPLSPFPSPAAFHPVLSLLPLSLAGWLACALARLRSPLAPFKRMLQACFASFRPCSLL
jgi:hypothetical protein